MQDLKSQNIIYVHRDGTLSFKKEKFKCSIGLNGISKNKIEGDKKTPAGLFPIRMVMFRSDRIKNIVTSLDILEILPDDGWCDDPTDKNYNQLIKLPYSKSYEKLWRHDNLYNIIIVIGFNDSPAIPYKGSAIFLHCASKCYKPTDGCIALIESDISKILLSVNHETQISIQA
tara:strand:- start:1274 stop:1792 length:519 start_codon:yes stop_codon:yes gene_type:complete